MDDGGAVAWVLSDRLVQTAALVVALGILYQKIARPIVKACKLLADRWDDVTAVADLKTEVSSIKQDLRPSNGDQRTISDRLDEIKHTSRDARHQMTSVEDRLSLVEDQASVTLRKVDLVLAERDYNMRELQRWTTQFREFEPPAFRAFGDTDEIDQIEPPK